MKKFNYVLFALLFPAFIMTGCGEGSKEDGEKQIEMSSLSEKSQQGYADEETTGGFTFTARSAWAATVSELGGTRASDVSWLRLLLDGTETYSGGAGTFTLTIAMDVNYSGETRSATITVTSGTDDITVTVTQSDKTEDGKVPVAGVLINGIMWAPRNVDAFGTFAAQPEDPGMFYQWNRKTAWLGTGDNPVSSPEGEVWDITIPTGDEWEAENDPCPEGWRLPTMYEQESLFSSADVTNEWTDLNGVDGRKFTDIESGASIFLPAAGLRVNSTGELSGPRDAGLYWSSSAYPGSGCCGWMMSFSPGSAYQGDYGRLAGLSVRCIQQ